MHPSPDQDSPAAMIPLPLYAPVYQPYVPQLAPDATDEQTTFYEQELEWASLLHHAPGLAQMLDVLREHVRNEPRECALCQATQRARLAAYARLDGGAA